MKFLLRILDKVRPSFETGGRFAFFKPLFDAMDGFCFSPDETTRVGPFARDSLDIKRYMSMVIIGLLPATFAGLYFSAGGFCRLSWSAMQPAGRWRCSLA